MTTYEEFQAEVSRRKRERWLRVVGTEPARRPVGRRPRDPEQERLLLALDRARLEREKDRRDEKERRARCESSLRGEALSKFATTTSPHP